MLFYHLTTHVKSDQDQDLLRFMSDRVAFPTVLYLTLKGEVMHKHAGERTVTCFEKEIHGYHQLYYAKLRLGLGEKSVALEILDTELRLGLLKHEVARKRLAAIDKKLLEEPKQKANVIESRLVALEAKEVYFGLFKGRTSKDRNKKRAKHAHEMLEAGRIPTDDAAWRFWRLLMLHAEQTKSLPLFDRASRRYQALRKDKLSDDDRKQIKVRRARLSGGL